MRFICSPTALSQSRTENRAYTHIYICLEKLWGVIMQVNVPPSPSVSSPFPAILYRDCSVPTSRATFSVPLATSRSDPFSTSVRICAQTNAGLLRSCYEIVPGGLASRKFITINRTRSDEHLVPQPLVYCVHEILCITMHPSKVAVSFTAHSPHSLSESSLHVGEKDDGIISSFVARDEKTRHVR